MNSIRTKLAFAGLSVMLVITVAKPLPAEIIRVLSPASAENVEGDTSRSPRFISHRVQFLFPASDFADLPETHRLIAAFNFRADRTQTPGALNFGDERIWMSTTSLSSLTSVFDNNHGTLDRPITHEHLGDGDYRGEVANLSRNPVILDWAATHDRTVITGDLNPMVGFALARVQSGEPMTGVVAWVPRVRGEAPRPWLWSGTPSA